MADRGLVQRQGLLARNGDAATPPLLAPATFRDWMTRERGLAERTAEVYAAMVDYGQRRGNVLLAVQKARTRGSLAVAAAALRAWGAWTRDERLAARVSRTARRREVGATTVNYITDEERKTLLGAVQKVEEPYRSAMTLVVGSGLRLSTVLDLSRTQVEVGCTERVPIIGPRRDVIGLWLPPPEIQAAFCVLPQYGAWTRVQDLFGRDYQHAYQQIRILLHYVCRKASIRQVKPSELSSPDSPVQAAMLDGEVCCA